MTSIIYSPLRAGWICVIMFCFPIHNSVCFTLLSNMGVTISHRWFTPRDSTSYFLSMIASQVSSSFSSLSLSSISAWQVIFSTRISESVSIFWPTLLDIQFKMKSQPLGYWDVACNNIGMWPVIIMGCGL